MFSQNLNDLQFEFVKIYTQILQIDLIFLYFILDSYYLKILYNFSIFSKIDYFFMIMLIKHYLTDFNFLQSRYLQRDFKLIHQIF